MSCGEGCNGCESGKFGCSCCCASVTNIKGGIHPDSMRTVTMDLVLEEADASQTITHISKLLLNEPAHIIGVDASLVSTKRDTTVDNSEKQLQQQGTTTSLSDAALIKATTPVNVALYTLPGWSSNTLTQGGFGAIEQAQGRVYITTASLTAQAPTWVAHKDLFGYFADGGLYVEFNAPSDQYGVRIVVRYVPRLQFSPAYHDPIDVMQHYWKCSRGDAEFLEGFYAGTSQPIPSIESSADTPSFDTVTRQSDDLDIYADPTVTNLLLDTYTGAQAAYSVRKLDKDYSGNCIRIRNATSGAELDVGFDTDGELDRVAIANHCGTANGFVVTWYDQSGNGRNMTQGTTDSQPQIYNGTTTFTRNKKPVIDFNGKVLAQTGLRMATANGYSFVVGGSSDGSGGFVLLPSDNLLNAAGIAANGNSGAAHLNQTVTSYHVNGAALDTATQDALFDAVGQQALVRISNHDNTEGSHRYYNMGYTAVASYDNLLLQELVIWHADQSSNATGIETDINSYFSIY